MYKDGLKHGYGEFYFSNERYMKCNWIKGKPHGEGIFKVESNSFEEKAEWIHGQFTIKLFTFN